MVGERPGSEVCLCNVLPGRIATETLHDADVHIEGFRGVMHDQCPDLTVSARAAPLCGTHTGDNGSFAKVCCLKKRADHLPRYPHHADWSHEAGCPSVWHGAGYTREVIVQRAAPCEYFLYVRLSPDVCVGDPAIQVS